MTKPHSSFARRAAKGLALVAALSLGAGDAFARPGGGKSSGSRGSMSQKAPPTTDTAPRTAQPLPGAPSQGVRQAGPAAAAGAAQAAQPSRMRSMLTGLGLGFLGAGLFGMLSGQGFFSGIGSMLGMLGFVLQIALVFFLVRWAFNYFRNKQPASANGSPTPDMQRQDMQRQGMMPGMMPPAAAMGGAGAASAVQGGPAPLSLQERDFNAFERLLNEIQDSFGKGDRSALHVRATPEMAGQFIAEIDALDRAGHASRISGVKLMQGDLAEAWQEPGAEYATVAMRFTITDAVVEKASGRVVEGSLTDPQEVTEVWTFVRRPGETSEGWKLSAIQQA